MNATLSPKNVLDAYVPASWVERRVINYARERLGEGAHPEHVLAELDAAREEIDDWLELEATYGIAEVVKLLGQQLMERMTLREATTTARTRIAGLSGLTLPESPLEQDRDAHAVFNLWRKPMHSVEAM